MGNGGYTITLSELIFRHIIFCAMKCFPGLHPNLAYEAMFSKHCGKSWNWSYSIFSPRWSPASPAVTYFFSRWDLFSFCLTCGELGIIYSHRKKKKKERENRNKYILKLAYLKQAEWQRPTSSWCEVLSNPWLDFWEVSENVIDSEVFEMKTPVAA